MNYDDIIDLPHHVSLTHPHMAIPDRAAQFAPFAALTGHEAAIKETARLTADKIILSEDARALLDEKLQFLLEQSGEKPLVSFTFFLPDGQKSGGAYITQSGTIKKMDLYQNTLILTDKTVIPIDDILEIEGDCFSSI
ncbi:MAG: hypothetical protein PHV18_16475 [Lachnospiraceae bacterium]|nr:hypothetical protein [Lachnospiraceae bacterium]